MRAAASVALEWLPWAAAIAAIAALGVHLAATWDNGPPTRTPSTSRLPDVECGDATVATFRWSPDESAREQWLDLSLFDNGFEEGTYQAAGPLPADATFLPWAGLRPGSVHFWRVNTLTESGWRPSWTGAFVPCGHAVPLSASYACDERGFARITFLWAPAAPPEWTWLDVSVVGEGFEEGSFFSFGPFNPDVSSFTWHGSYPNMAHHWRLNTLRVDTWWPSDAALILPEC